MCGEVLFLVLKMSYFCLCLVRAQLFRALHDKRSLLLPLCPSVCHLPFCASVGLSSLPVRLSALPFSPRVAALLRVDSCHMRLKRSVFLKSCDAASVPDHARVGLGNVDVFALQPLYAREVAVHPFTCQSNVCQQGISYLKRQGHGDSDEQVGPPLSL